MQPKTKFMRCTSQKNNKSCYSDIFYYSWSADARATDELTSGIARCSCAPSLDSVLAPKIQKRNIFGKGVSNLRACLDYCEDPARSCEKLFSCPNRSVLLTEKPM